MNKLWCGLLLCAWLVLPAQALEWGPWSVTSAAPTLTAPANRPARLPVAGAEPPLPQRPFYFLLDIYKQYISPLDGDRCPMYPTCSQYCSEAIHKHGLLIGIIMTSDRLMHEPDERRFTPAVKVGSRYRILDPVQDNDFWWNKP